MEQPGVYSDEQRKERVAQLIEEIKRRYCQQNGVGTVSYRELSADISESGYQVSYSPLSSYAARRSLPGTEALMAIAGYTGRTLPELEYYLSGKGSLAEYFDGHCRDDAPKITLNVVKDWMANEAELDDLGEVIAHASILIVDRSPQHSNALLKVVQSAISGTLQAELLVEAARQVGCSEAELLELLSKPSRGNANVE